MSSHHLQRPDVAPVEDVVVGELEDEVDGDGAPDGHVVEGRPVVGVQGDLRGHHDHQDGGDHRAEDHVVGEVDPVGGDLVVVGACTKERDKNKRISRLREK